MKPEQILKLANGLMVGFLVTFIVAFWAAWNLEQTLPLIAVSMLHIAQIITAALFKLSYVLRLIAQNLMGQPLH